MANTLQIAKGAHPGWILEKALKDRGLSQGQFALSIQEYPQTINAIIKGKRNMNIPLAMRIEHALSLDEGFFMTLQVFYDIAQEKTRQSRSLRPDLSKFRPALFWDTKIENIDWNKQKSAVINRVFERGTLTEKKAAVEFYGSDTIKHVLKNAK